MWFLCTGMAPMPWTINSEIYPLWARGTCTSIAATACWSSNLVISFTFLSMTEAITTYGRCLVVVRGVGTVETGGGGGRGNDGGGGVMTCTSIAATACCSSNPITSCTFFSMTGDITRPACYVCGAWDWMRDQK